MSFKKYGHHLIYPSDTQNAEKVYGFLPVDFITELALESGLDWFRKTPESKNYVFGRLNTPLLRSRYGQDKIDEIAEYINATEIRIMQAFPRTDETSPSISINLANSTELGHHAGLDDFAGEEAVLGTDSAGNQTVTEKEEYAYYPAQDELLLGIHATGSPDKAKYIYLLTMYILNSLRDSLEAEGIFNITFRATDLSRLNDYLPEHMFSRFVTMTFESLPLIHKAKPPMITDFALNVRME